MKVTIESVTHLHAETHVCFSTDFGGAIASWKGSPPKIGARYDVELDIDEIFVWGRNANPASGDVCSIGLVEGSIILTGNVISVGTDGVAAINVGGSVILLEIIQFSGAVPVFVDLKAEKISLFPTGM
ncbi:MULTISPECIES: hypothetical protein [unclassified Pseudomonas]|uniref:Uncharacterized protein n=1 Tax=Pseudomonas sp. MYb327 TaxID=2745230 RepID=A0AAU8E6T0_9PSED